MNIFCPLVAPLAEKINFSPKQKFSEFQRICHIYVSNWALARVDQYALRIPKMYCIKFYQIECRRAVLGSRANSG